MNQFFTLTFTDANGTFVLADPEADPTRQFHNVKNGELRPYLFRDREAAEAVLVIRAGAVIVAASIG